MAGPEGVSGGWASGSAQHPCRCLFQCPPAKTKAFAPGSWPVMQPESLLDLKQTMNYPQVSAIISTQDDNFLSYMVNLKVTDGDRGWVGVALNRDLGDGVIHGPVL